MTAQSEPRTPDSAQVPEGTPRDSGGLPPDGLFAALARTDEARAVLLFDTAAQANAFVESLRPLLNPAAAQEQP